MQKETPPMTDLSRRAMMIAAAGGAASLALHPAIARAQAIPAHVRKGDITDVEHVVILMQENRSFDHYFGAMNGVRGFGDPLVIPSTGEMGAGSTCWLQPKPGQVSPEACIAPFALKTGETFAHMRIEGTPHVWADAQFAWDDGRMSRWPHHKTAHSMGYYERSDLPFQYALADAFTVCDAYHCSFQGGTNPNRLFLWTGTNDPGGQLGGPGISNSHDNFASKGGAKDGYRWTTYVERLTQAGVSWRIYQDMSDNFEDNPLAGFQVFRDSFAGVAGADLRLAELAHTTRHLDGLKEDVLSGSLPQVSYIIAPAKDSEHPGPSSPAQGADYTARVLDALTSDPAVWAKTVLLVMFDENDGFFDHVPPPAPPTITPEGPAGGSTIDLTGEYHQVKAPSQASADRETLMGKPYGLGPRVPMYVISPWSRGGWVNSEVFDHTSVIRFLETRFGVIEPNISPWRRAVCGDLTSAFDFKSPNDTPLPSSLPDTATTAALAGQLPRRTRPPTPDRPTPPVQAAGVRPIRPTPYRLRLEERRTETGLRLGFINEGRAGAVFHVYDQARPQAAPRRYTVGAGAQLEGEWSGPGHDLFVLGPDGFHRRLKGEMGVGPQVELERTRSEREVRLVFTNPGREALRLKIETPSHSSLMRVVTFRLEAGERSAHSWNLTLTHGWYDLAVTSADAPGFVRRFAGRVDAGKPAYSDPGVQGEALLLDPFSA
jgi:phospholipase C